MPFPKPDDNDSDDDDDDDSEYNDCNANHANHVVNHAATVDDDDIIILINAFDERDNHALDKPPGHNIVLLHAHNVDNPVHRVDDLSDVVDRVGVIHRGRLCPVRVAVL